MGSYRNIHQITSGDEPEHEERLVSRPLGAVFVLLGGLVILLFGGALSIALGAADIKLGTVWDALFHFDSKNTAHQIILELRLPRTVSAMLVGACLAVSGAIMQGMTRNPLASPDIMSVTDGSAFAIAVAFACFPGISALGLMAWSFAGAGLGAAIVFAVGMFSKGGLTPVKLALAGTAVGTFLRALSSGIAIHFDVARDVSFWYLKRYRRHEMVERRAFGSRSGTRIDACLFDRPFDNRFKLGRGIGKRAWPIDKHGQNDRGRFRRFAYGCRSVCGRLDWFHRFDHPAYYPVFGRHGLSLDHSVFSGVGGCASPLCRHSGKDDQPSF